MQKMNDNNSNNYFEKVPIKKINIGCISGENEAKDPLFEELFYTGNKKYEELCKASKFIIKGRKGTGKTILAYYFKKKAEENNIKGCEIYSLSDLNLQKLVHLEGREFYKEEYSLFWKYCMFLEIGKLILDKTSKILKKFNPKIRKLNEFITERYESRYEIVEFIKVNEKSSSGNFEKNEVPFKFGLNKSYKDEYKYKTHPYYKDIDTLEKLVFDILKSNQKGYVVMFDNLDELGDELDTHKNYRNMIIGMILSLHEVNSKITNVNENSKIVLIIRSDILDSLNKYSSNIRKIIVDNSIDLYWVSKEYNSIEECLLIDMILTKIKYSVDEYKNVSKKDLYNELFPDDISGRDTVSYLLDMSMGRPRQVVELLKCIINKYETSTEFISSHFRGCLKYYSQELYKDLQNEFSIHENKNELNECLNLIGDFKHRSIKYKELIEFYEGNKDKYPNIRKETFEDCLNQLYSFGVIGEIKKMPNKQTKLSWGYRLDGDDRIKFKKNTQLIVHMGLRHKFNL